MKKSLFLLILIGMAMPLFSQLKTGQQAPELFLPDSSGQTIPLSALKGQVVLLDFWASWCEPCRRNNPHLVRLYQKYRSKGLAIYGVSIDANQLAWRQAIREDKLTWIQVNDEKGWEAPSAQAYGVDAIPASFLMNRDGIVEKINPSVRGLEAQIRHLLKL
jgi:peroxiredoxin